MNAQINEEGQTKNRYYRYNTQLGRYPTQFLRYPFLIRKFLNIPELKFLKLLEVGLFQYSILVK